MPRRIHLIGKKRGDRRTVPPWMGPAGEIVYYAGLVVCGLAAFTYLLVGYLLPEWWANRNYVETTCQVLDTRVDEREIDGSRRFRPEIQITYIVDGQQRGPTWTYNARYAYEFDQEQAERIAAAFEPQARYSCWYNPINPAAVVVVRDLSVGLWLLLFVPAAVTAFGGYKLTRTVLSASRSVERQAQAEAGMLGHERERRPGLRGSRDARFPAVPAIDDIVNSPGTRLAFRLPGDGGSMWQTGGLAAMAIFFGAVLAALVVSAVASGGGILRRVAEFGFIAPLLLVQVVLSRQAIRQWLRTTRSGSSRLEVSDHPFLPGETYQAMLFQAGKLRVRRLEVQLICQEEATYSPGTDTRVAREIVYRDVVWRRDFMEVRPGAALEVAFNVPMPAEAMHSFVAAHNRIDWYILVRLRTAGGGFDRRFPVCVYPSAPPVPPNIHRAGSLVSQ